MEPPARKAIRRLLRELAAPGAALIRPAAPDREADWSLRQSGGSDRSVSPDHAEYTLRQDWIGEQTAGTFRLTATGRAALRRMLAEGDAFLAQHRHVAPAPDPDHQVERSTSGPGRIQINLKESPLAWLASRKDRNGRALLDVAQVAAGERLRNDYSFASLMPSVGKGWRTERVASGPGNRDFSEDVMGARQRVERILSGMPPVLAGVAVDVCCHLKGLETVEAERGWPARSAKVVLQIALDSLAERYGERVMGPDRSGPVRGWVQAGDTGNVPQAE